MTTDAASALASLWALGADRAAVAGDAPDRLSFTGAGQILPSVFEVTTAAASSVAAATLAAAEVGTLRGGPRGPIIIDRRHAALAFRSERYVTIDEAAPENLWAPLSGHYEADDGWVQLHCNFDHHRDAALRALGLQGGGVDVDRATVADVIAGTAATDVEDAVVAEGGCAAALRTAGEWRAHPHGRTVPSVPLVRIERIGDAPPRPLPALRSGARPLADLRVLDLTRVIAGPVCGRTLAAHGASVLRIGAPHLPTTPVLVIDTGFGKRSAHLDLRHDGDAAALGELVDGADVFVQGYRPGAVDGLGFGPQALAGRRPGIVAVSLSAWGGDGPWSGRRGFDSLVQTASGIAHAGGEAAGRAGPGPLPAQALDHASGYLMAFGACVALRRRAIEGGSWHVGVSLARTGEWLQSLGRTDSLGLPDPAPGDDPDLVATTPTPFGTVSHIRPVGGMEPAPRWDLPPTPFGADEPRW